MKLKLESWDQKIEKVRKNNERLYDEYLNNRKLYNRLLQSTTKGELIWQVVNGTASDINYHHMNAVRQHQDKIKAVEEKIKTFQNKYLATEDMQLYMKGLVTADMDLLKKSYRMGNMDAAYIWGLVSLQNNITDNDYSDAIKALEIVTSSNIHAADAKIALAEYYEQHGLTEAENLRLSEDELIKSLKYYEDAKKHAPNMASDIKERIEIIQRVIKCYKDKKKTEVKVNAKNTSIQLKVRLSTILSTAVMVVFTILIIELTATKFKHSIHLDLEYSPRLELFNPNIDTVVIGNHTIAFTESFPFLRGNIIPLLPFETKIRRSVYEWENNVETIKFKKGVTIMPNLGISPPIPSVDLPDTIVEIAPNAFRGWKSLKTAILPSHLTHIPEGAFANSGLESIDIPDNIKEIGSNAFNGTSLKSITLPYGIETISKNNFRELETIYVDERDYQRYKDYFESKAKVILK